MCVEALSSLFVGVRSDLAQEVEFEAEENEDVVVPASELESALALLRELGHVHHPTLVESIRATLRKVRGAEPSDCEIAEMFARISGSRDEFVEHYNCDDDSADCD